MRARPGGGGTCRARAAPAAGPGPGESAGAARGGFGGDSGRNCFMERVIRHRNELPGQAVQAPWLEVFGARSHPWCGCCGGGRAWLGLGDLRGPF